MAMRTRAILGATWGLPPDAVRERLESGRVTLAEARESLVWALADPLRGMAAETYLFRERSARRTARRRRMTEILRMAAAGGAERAAALSDEFDRLQAEELRECGNGGPPDGGDDNG